MYIVKNLNKHNLMMSFTVNNCSLYNARTETIYNKTILHPLYYVICHTDKYTVLCCGYYVSINDILIASRYNTI